MAWRLMSSYWHSQEKWKARGLLAGVIALTLGQVYMLVLLNGWNNDFYNALQQRAFESFWPLIGQFAGFAFLHIIFAVYAVYVRQILDKEMLDKCRTLLDSIVCDDRIIEYIVSIISVTRPEIAGAQKGNDILRYISYGASPRASIALAKCAKARALFQGRTFVLPEDVKVTAPSVLRHRLVLSYEAGADGVTADELIDKIVSFIPVP